MTTDRKILLVDDDPLVRRTLSRILSREYSVDTASNGKEALVRMRTEGYSAVISDVNMPEMNGHELLKEAEESGLATRKKFLFLTGDGSSNEAVALKNMGAAILHKTLPVKELRRSIKELLWSE